ncbi:DUF4349 domain-containing protein [Massilia genomosp. 1]|uniref:DUF4349 domain-containing protein n=1 Tax=Massilia genomosp. 1 TaxID=2609280 RepID=A0ABX0MJA7_9BURK|nr:DUF4349 domain-containing protein [Massilia genomosp. 1]NHZ62866.1 DUF4349 domain-containing protein [Massilia genomosp. 1]
MKILSGIVVALFLCACSQKMEVAAGAAMPEAVETKLIEAPEPPGSRRYIATRHTLLLEAPEAELHKHFEAIQAACLKLACVVLNADQSQARLHSPANASLSARIPPQAFDSFLKTILEHGKLLQHERDSEDLTAQVIDVEAKIANLTALKARILDLLAKRTGNLKEVLEAEKQLSQTQSELDSISGQRKALASQTEMDAGRAEAGSRIAACRTKLGRAGSAGGQGIGPCAHVEPGYPDHRGRGRLAVVAGVDPPVPVLAQAVPYTQGAPRSSGDVKPPVRAHAKALEHLGWRHALPGKMPLHDFLGHRHCAGRLPFDHAHHIKFPGAAKLRQ